MAKLPVYQSLQRSVMHLLLFIATCIQLTYSQRRPLSCTITIGNPKWSMQYTAEPCELAP